MKLIRFITKEKAYILLYPGVSPVYSTIRTRDIDRGIYHPGNILSTAEVNVWSVLSTLVIRGS